MKWGLWSTTAASNSATPPDGWPEGQAPSTVNDCAREMMAAIATGLQDIQFVDLGFAPTQTSGNTFTVSGTHADVIHYGRRLKLSDGVNTLYATVISATATSNTAVALRFDTGTSPLDSSLSSFAVGSPGQVNGALPESAYRHANAFINPYMDIWQRRGTGGATNPAFSISAAGSFYTADRWKVQNTILSAGFVVAITRGERSAAASNVPTLAQCGVFLTNSLVISCNAALAGVAAADVIFLEQVVEGYNYRNLAGKPITASFWVNSDVTGTYCVALINTNGTQSMVLEYSVSAVSTWEKKVLTFAPPPSAGTWDYSGGAGLRVRYALLCGTSFQGGAGNWTATNLLATVNQVNFLGAANKRIMFTAMRLGEGTQDMPLEDINIGLESNKCKRYCRTIESGNAIIGCAGNTQSALFPVPLGDGMRGAASATYPAVSALGVQAFSGAVSSVSAVGAASNVTFDRLDLSLVTVGGPLTAFQPYLLFVSAGAQIILDAEIF